MPSVSFVSLEEGNKGTTIYLLEFQRIIQGGKIKAAI